MPDARIRVVVRIKPSKRPSGFFHDDETERGRLDFNVPLEEQASWLVNNSRTNWGFKFHDILGPEADQARTFDAVGKGAVESALEGFNSTVFAYGQTGSGKTFTITGGPERYADRGIIPRAISMLFQEFHRRSGTQFSAYVSYLEIYNDQGYDLLNEDHDARQLEDLPRVSLLEDASGTMHLRNLSMRRASTEEDALNFLFLGDTNRAISETAMNKASSRSHCIFTVSLEARQGGSDVVKRSKLHFVDLAGSERVAKTGTTGQTLREATYINSSLFFLEMVIKALHERANGSRTHVPYRNSMMTSVLRDSLGGNAKTVMVATVNPEAEHTDESISTARFAQRVSHIKNDARVNEETDPAVVIQRLRAEVQGLREQVQYLQGEAGEEGALSEDTVARLQEACGEYVESVDPEAELRLGRITLLRVRDCFAILKNMVLEARADRAAGGGGRSDAAGQSGGGSSSGSGDGDGGGAALRREVGELQATLKQRDEEIAILVNMVHQGRRLPSRGPPPAEAAQEAAATEGKHVPAAPHVRQRAAPEVAVAGVGRPPDARVLESPQEAFSYFRSRCPRSKPLEENKEVLRAKYTEAKRAGAAANEARQRIQYLKQTIENLRRERALDGLMDGMDGDTVSEEARAALEEEDRLKRDIEVLKRQHQEGFGRLRKLKAEIEHIQRIMEKSRARIQADFDEWYSQMLSRSEDNAASSPPADAKTAAEAPGQPDTAAHPVAPAKDAAPQPPYLTGNKEADADIMAFYAAKEALSRRVGGQ